ncbi:MAG: hypothetical protein OEQ39_12095, partial [Gammaproteobacteria bacterium]|nr:hypothetical protein [Gammaproteobacteria bacterium]
MPPVRWEGTSSNAATEETVTKIAVAGAAGRMGRAIISLCQGRAEMQVSAALECTDSEFIGVDAG